jgi:hypothetical protein
MNVTYPIINLNINNETIVFSDKDVIQAEVVQEIHPIGMELPASTARIRVYLDNEVVDENNRTIRDKFSPFTKGIYYQSMVTGLIVDIKESIDGVTHTIGRFYLEEWNNPKEGELELVCIDAIGMLDKKNFLGNFYETPTTVRTIIADIMAGVDIQYEIDAVIADKTLKGYLPGNKTLRESLQHVLFACGAYATTAGVNATGQFALRIKESVLPLGIVTYPVYYYDDAAAVYDNAGATYAEQHIDAYITDDEKTDSQSLNIMQLVTGVEIVSHDYAKGTVVEEIFSAQLTPGDYMVVYPKPYHWVSATGIGDAITYLATANDTVDEIILLPQSLPTEDEETTYEVILTGYGEFEYGTNYVYLTVPEVEGEIPEVVVTGKPWLDSTQIFKWQNPDSIRAFNSGDVYDSATALYGTSTYRRDWTVNAPPNIWKIDDATLVPSIQTTGEETVEAVLARVSDYAKLRYQQNVTLFPRTDVEPGEVDLVDSLYGKQVVGVVERMVSKLSGGYLIDAEFVGTERTSI